MKTVEDIFDITILGGGPTGLFAAFYAGMRGSSCKIIDSMPALGGRLTAVYPEKYIYDVGGFPKILSKDLVQNLIDQITPYETTICLEETTQTLTHKDGLWHIGTNRGEHRSRCVIIAAGVGTYSPKRHSALGAEQWEGHGLSYSVLDKQIYAGKRVIVVGGGDSALDWANEFVSIANEVHLVHRSEKFRAHEDSIKKLACTKAELHLNREVLEFVGSEKFEGIRVQHLESREEHMIHADAAVVLIGFNSSLGPLKEWGLELSGNGICVNERMETNLPGIFAAGDIARHSAKLDLIATGFSEAAIAVAFAKVYINPKEKAQPLHSTTVMEIKEKQQRARQKNG